MPSTPNETSPGRLRESLTLFAPGILAGCHFAILLFFLNPDLEFSVGSVARTLTVFGLAGGLGSALVLTVALGRYPRARRRSLPWTLTAALILAAGAQWFHASAFSFFLPPGLDNRLIKAALLTSVLAVAAFYIALLHSLWKRPYRSRSRTALLVVSLLSLLISLERRAAFPGFEERTGIGALFPSPPDTRLLVVALEGASLDAILPLAKQGQLPFLATLLQRGVHGGMSTMPPVRRLPSWFTVSTGSYPYRHGVAAAFSLSAPFVSSDATVKLWPWGSGMHRWGFLLGVRPTIAAPRHTDPKLWEILQGLGVTTALVGWPAEAGHLTNQSLALADRFFNHPENWQGTTPAQSALARRAAELRPTVDGVDPNLFTPLGEGIGPEIREALVEDLWRESAARDLLSTRPDVGALFIDLPGLLEASRNYFGGYAAVQFDGDTAREPQAAAKVVIGYYGFVDALLQRLWDQVPGPKLMVVASVNGVREPSRALQFWSTITGGSAIGGRVDRRADGVVLLLGEHLRTGAFLDRSALIDIAPTVLYGLGLPVARDTDGSVRTAAFATGYLTENPLTFVPSYDSLVPRDDLPMLQVPRAAEHPAPNVEPEN